MIALLLIIAVLILAVAALIYFHDDGPLPVDPKNPLWRMSTRRAQETIPLMKQLHADKTLEVMVKYPLVTSAGEREHLWGILVDLTGSEMKVTIETPPVTDDKPLPDGFIVPIEELEDWQVDLPDGKIRGGFTTQADMILAKRAHHRMPWHVRLMEGKFVDTLVVEEGA